MNWNYHPKPFSKPITAREAIKGLPDTPRVPLSDRATGLWHKMKPGQLASEVQEKRNDFSLCKIHPDKPCPTITKSQTPGNGLCHWGEPRHLSIPELAALSSFPPDFQFTGSVRQQAERIGNCVPPLLMKAIARNLRLSPFLKENPLPTAVDTFSGTGGSSLGLELAGFRELLAVEFDDHAAESFRLNFSDTRLFHGDIKDLTVRQALTLTGLREGELDLFTGSPPCQGFSTSGQRKLNDDRNSLFLEYARLLEGFKPKCFVMENVTGMVKGHMKIIAAEIFKTLKSKGYRVKGQILNAKHYGVAQSRERVILVGVREDLAERFGL